MKTEPRTICENESTYMDDYTKIEKILSIVKSKIDAHNEFKKEYDRQLAFDFSLFNFFNVGENKVSQILAYFLDEKQNHGQGNIFLNEFVNFFCDCNQEIDSTNSINICEKSIATAMLFLNEGGFEYFLVLFLYVMI